MAAGRAPPSLSSGSEGGEMARLGWIARVVGTAAIAAVVAASAGTRSGAAALPPGNTVAQWNKIAEDMVVGSGTNLPEGFPYMAYVSAAVYDAVVAIDGGYETFGPSTDAPAGASADAAVVEAAYRTLWAYFPAEACNPVSASYAF